MNIGQVKRETFWAEPFDVAEPAVVEQPAESTPAESALVGV